MQYRSGRCLDGLHSWSRQLVLARQAQAPPPRAVVKPAALVLARRAASSQQNKMHRRAKNLSLQLPSETLLQLATDALATALFAHRDRQLALRAPVS